MKPTMNLISPWRDDQSQRFITIFKIFKNQSQRFMTLEIFKNQSQRFMTIFRNFKNQSQRFMITFRNFINHGADLSTLTVSLPFSRFYGSFFISHGFTNFKWIFFKTHSFLRKQTQAAHSNAAEERISSIINKNKTDSRSFLSLSWALLFIVLEKTYIDNPFQRKTPADLIKKVKKSIAEYNTQHSSK